MTGVFGCGKTLLGQALLNELTEDRYKIAFIANPQMSYEELLMYIATHLGARELPVKKNEIMINVILDVLEKVLKNNMQDGKDSVVILDEAHIINDPNIFEELRLLLNFQTQERFMLTLLLFGQPELKEKIDNNKQLEQRIAVKAHLDSLTPQETTEYINHRLFIAGGQQPIFTESALSLIFDRTGGIPRRINRLSDSCLLAGFAKNQTVIDKDIVLEEAKSLGG